MAFEHVNYRYQHAENLALEDIDFSAKSGETVAIIGGTGSGKTTLVNLLPRFYDVESGKILLNGKNIKDTSQHNLREMIGFVPQKAVLFTGTIRENMQYGAPNATDEEIWQALEIAQAKAFVSELAEGLIVMSNKAAVISLADNASGCIARALVKPADVYVLMIPFLHWISKQMLI